METVLPAFEDNIDSLVDQYENQQIDHEFDKTRLKPNELTSDEPTQQEIVEATLNEPSSDNYYIVEVGGKLYPITEWTFREGLIYTRIFIPKFESIIKSFLPLLELGVSHYNVIKFFDSEIKSKMKKLCQLGDKETIKKIFNEQGLEVTQVDIDNMIEKSLKERDWDFSLAYAYGLLRPLGGGFGDFIDKFSFANLFLELEEKLPLLTMATLKSSLRRRQAELGPEYVRNDLKRLEEEMEMMDSIDHFNIVRKQIEFYLDKKKFSIFIGAGSNLAAKMSFVTGMH